MYIQQFFTVAAIVMVSSTCQILRSSGIFVNLARIVLLRFDIVIIVVMVESINLGRQSGSFHLRTERCFHEVSLFFPFHIERSGVATVQRFILRSYCINVNAFGFKCLYPFHKISSIILIIIRVQLSVRPRIQWCTVCQAFHFHPFRTGPRSGNYLDRRVNGQNLFQDRKDIVLFFALQSKVLDPFRITAGIFA